MFYVYVLQSERDAGLYIGYTSHLKHRLRQHNSGESKATSARCPLELIYYEAYVIREDAEGRELFLKSGAGRCYLDKQLRCYFELHPHRTRV
jgi:putative endonuclease